MECGTWELHGRGHYAATTRRRVDNGSIALSLGGNLWTHQVMLELPEVLTLSRQRTKSHAARPLFPSVAATVHTSSRSSSPRAGVCEYAKPNHAIKAFLINRPRLRGFGNGYMQETLFRAGILPTRKVCPIDKREKQRLYRAIRGVLTEATKKGGSADSCDIYGRPGKYVKALGTKVKACTVCHTTIERKSFLGGRNVLLPALSDVTVHGD